MTDAGLLGIVVVVLAATGLALLDGLRATPRAAADRLLEGLAAGLGIAGACGLALASLGLLHPVPLAVLGAAGLAAGGRALGRAVAAVDRAALGRTLRRAGPALLVCAALLAAEAVTMLAPPIGGDQTKYQLAYPRLYAAAGRLVPTPWSFWGQMQFLQNFDFAIGYALRGAVLARYLNGLFGVLAALALARLGRRHLGPGTGLAAGALFFTLPLTWSLMTRAGSDLGVVLYLALATGALLDWIASQAAGDLRRAALLAGLAGGSKVMGLLVPTLVGTAVLVTLAWKAVPPRRAAGAALGFGLLVLVAASPCYVRNALDTGNPIYPFGYGVFGGAHWSGAASEYLADYYRQYQTAFATRRAGEPYADLVLTRFPWDLTMHPDSFENGARQSLDVGPFMLAFAPALVLVRRRRAAALTIAALGVGYAGIIAGAAWAHPRYVVPGVALALLAAAAAAPIAVGRRVAALVVALTVAGHLALIGRLLNPLWPDQLRVATGRMAPAEFLRRHSPRAAFWEQANAAVPAAGRVLVLEKIPHPYYIERPFVLASYLEQGLIDYRAVDTAEDLAERARALGVTHVAIDLGALGAAGDPFEATVEKLWHAFVTRECEPVVRTGDFALYALRPPTALAEVTRG